MQHDPFINIHYVLDVLSSPLSILSSWWILYMQSFACCSHQCFGNCFQVTEKRFKV